MPHATPKVEEIFSAALEIDNPEARSEYLDAACGDPGLRRRVEQLLEAAPEAQGFLADPASLPVTTAARDPHPPEGPGEVIGPYRLLEAIGEGGMGVVYVAEQHEPVRRRVALKVIKPGMDSRQVVARFEAERQALAMMDHPNIAKVHDAGMTPAGRPYFVMELVRGLPITEYCDREELSIAERLELFVLVCRAVQHAHQKGIIHRDLKPSNVLVTVIDGVPTPKVIDFGVAKATGGALTEKTLYTGFHQFVGTPLYTSPEQADLASTDVDTRSDIYSLGVLLYELLTGTTPFDSETLRKAAFDEMRRIIREEEPPRPSTRLSSMGETLSTVSARRKADPKRLVPSIRGDLDWVVMKALEKDRRRRYETANDFAADVMLYLTGRAVEAHPPSSWYRFSKFARRNRAAITLGAVAGVALAIVVGGLVVAVVVISREQARTASAYEAESKQRRLARQAVDEMYTQVAEKWLAQQPKLSSLQREFLDKALTYYERFADEQGTDPRALFDAATARARVANIERSLGRLEKAEAATRAALAQMENLVAGFPDDDAFLDGLALRLTNVAGLESDRGRHAEAERYVRRAAEVEEKLVVLHPGNKTYRLGLAKCLGWQGELQDILGRRLEAEAALSRSREVLAKLRSEDSSNHDYRAGLASIEMALGILYRSMGRFPEAQRSYRAAAEVQEALVAEEPEHPEHRKELAITLINQSVVEAIASPQADGVEIVRRAEAKLISLVEDYPDRVEYREQLLGCWEVCCQLLMAAGRSSEADQVARRAVESGERLVRDHGALIDPRRSLSVIRSRLADISTASPGEPFCDPRSALESAQRGLDLHPGPERSVAWQSLGWARYRVGDWKGCIEALEKQTEYAQKGDYFAAMAYHRLGDPAKARDRYDRFDRWLAGYETRWNPSVYPPPAMLRRFRAEAKALLGLVDPPGDKQPGDQTDRK